jgi:hypothetical protein
MTLYTQIKVTGLLEKAKCGSCLELQFSQVQPQKSLTSSSSKIVFSLVLVQRSRGQHGSNSERRAAVPRLDLFQQQQRPVSRLAPVVTLLQQVLTRQKCLQVSQLVYRLHSIRVESRNNLLP